MDELSIKRILRFLDYVYADPGTESGVTMKKKRLPGKPSFGRELIMKFD